MSVWTWVLIGLCAAGALLPLVSAIAVLRMALRLARRVDQLQHARLFTSIESLQLQSARLESIGKEAAPLAQRAQEAVQHIRSGLQDPAFIQMRNALQSSGAEIQSLVDSLR